MNRERTEAKMNDREALAAALATRSHLPLAKSREPQWEAILAAARERLAQLPETCPECQGTLTVEPPISGTDPHGVAASSPCFACNRTGKVYPAELVERIADTIAHAMSTGVGRLVTVPVAVAVLDALNGETE